jgi:hypothetical protein
MGVMGWVVPMLLIAWWLLAKYCIDWSYGIWVDNVMIAEALRVKYSIHGS